MVVVELFLAAEHEHHPGVVQVIRCVDGREASDAEVADHLIVVCQRLGRRDHRQVSPEEAGERGFLAEDQAPDVGVQPVGVVAGGVVVDLAEIVAHDLHVPVRRDAGELGEVDHGGSRPAFPIHCQPVLSRRERLDARQHAHLLRDFHRRTEQVDGVATGFAQRRRAFDHGDVEAATGQPVRQYRPGDARAGNENPHDDLRGAYLTFGKPRRGGLLAGSGLLAGNYVPAPFAVLWSWAFWVKMSPSLGLKTSSSLTAMTLPAPAPWSDSCTEPDATTVPASPHCAAPNRASVAAAAAPAKNTCITRICRRPTSAELIWCALLVMHHVYGFVVSAG